MTVLTPREYYNNQFRDDFYHFIKTARVEERDGDLYIPIQNLNKNKLVHIKTDHLPLFYYSLAFTTLIDVILNTYFNQDYADFQAMTQYPKFEHINRLRVTPWQLAELDFKPKTFKEFSRFFLDDQKQFFTRHIFGMATWDSVLRTMLEDPLVSRGRAGEVFVSVLKEHTLN